MKFKKQTNCVYYCDYHLILCTKYRRKIFNNGILEYMKFKLQEITQYYPELEFKKVNHDEDHIHVLLSIPPKMSIGDVVRIIKSNTTNGLKKKFEFLKKVYWGTTGIWSDGYFISTIGINEDQIKRYIELQGKEDSGQAKLELG